MAGITSYGAYIPLIRLARAEIAKAWSGRGLPGEKAVANYDEDAVTMAVAAAIDCTKGLDRNQIDGVYFASTSAPYIEKQSAALIAQVLNLDNRVSTMDFGGSLRSGTNALRAALDAVNSGSANNILVCAADVRPAYPKGDKEFSFGDGAAAIMVGKDNVIAEIEGVFTQYNELMDVWRSDHERYVNSWESTFIYSKGYAPVIAKTVAGALEKYNLKPEEFKAVAFNSPNSRQLGSAVRMAGFDVKTQVNDILNPSVGDTGSAMALMALVAELEEAGAGDRLLLANYGDGCDVLIIKATSKLADITGRRGIKKHLASKQMISNYNRYLLWRGEVNTEPPRRVPLERPSPAALLRDNKGGLGFFGVKCTNCGTVQYPAQRICMKCKSKDQFEDHCFADKPGKVSAFSHDSLGVSLDPPITGATIDFEGGGRIKLDMTDRDPKAVTVGMSVEMTFRKLRYVNGVYDYWWKCRPQRS